MIGPFIRGFIFSAGLSAVAASSVAEKLSAGDWIAIFAAFLTTPLVVERGIEWWQA